MKLEEISLVIPVYNEEVSIEGLIDNIKQQTRQPTEVIFVDGGSTDKTIEILERTVADQSKFKLIKALRASPGKGRNIGVENASHKWIIFTDAGITLDKEWIENLVKARAESSNADIVYGNYSPVANTFFEKCAAISYVPSLRKNQIRGKAIVSCLLKRSVWESVGGFPDLRAAEDLIFMEDAEKKGAIPVFAPNANVYWHLRPNLASTFQKFVLYSKYNVWAGRQWDWHYGILKQYLLIALFLILSVSQSPLWLIGVVLWLLARTAKRILPHRYEFGLMPLFNPIYFLSIMFLVVVIDIATFVGWIQAVLNREGLNYHKAKH